MRAFILTFALSLPLGLAACADSPSEEAAEAIDEQTEERADAIEEQGDELAEAVEDGDLFGTYDTDGDMMISETEYTEAGLVGDFGEYDADGDGMYNEEEYGLYESSLDM